MQSDQPGQPPYDHGGFLPPVTPPGKTTPSWLKWLIIGLIAILIACCGGSLLLYAVGRKGPAPAPTPGVAITTPTPPPTTAGDDGMSTTDQAFVAAMRSQSNTHTRVNWAVASDQTIINLGRNTCDYIGSDGGVALKAAQDYYAKYPDDDTAGGIGYLFGAARAAYCPQYPLN